MMAAATLSRNDLRNYRDSSISGPKASCPLSHTPAADRDHYLVLFLGAQAAKLQMRLVLAGLCHAVSPTFC